MILAGPRGAASADVRWQLRSGHVNGAWAAIGAVVVVQALSGTLSWAAAVPLVLGWVSWMLFRRVPFGPAARGWVLLGLVLATVALVSLVVGLPGVLGEDSSFYALKATITTPLGDHNELAGWLLVAIGLAAAVRTDRFVALAVLGLGLGATLSRGALAAGVVAAGAAWVAGADRAVLRRVLRTLAIAGAVVLAAVALLDTAAPADGPTSSAAARIELWQVALDNIADEPLVGVGVGGFERTAADVAGPHHHAHNGTLHSMSELGLVVGGITALRLPVATWLLVRRRGTRWMHAAGVAGLLLLAHDQVEALALRGVSEVVVGALLALAVRQGEQTPPVPSAPAPDGLTRG